MRIPVGFSKMHLGRVKLVKITKNFLFFKKKSYKGKLPPPSTKMHYAATIIKTNWFQQKK